MKVFLIFLLLFSSNSFATQGITCRNPSVTRQFDKEQGFPHGRKGYVRDHICPLVCGGLDITSNLQYQTIEEGKKKDKWETSTAGCKLLCNETNSLPYRTVFNCR